MNNPSKKQIFASKIVVFRLLDYFSASVSLGFGLVFTTFIALSGPTVAQALIPSITLLEISVISSFSLNSSGSFIEKAGKALSELLAVRGDAACQNTYK